LEKDRSNVILDTQDFVSQPWQLTLAREQLRDQTALCKDFVIYNRFYKDVAVNKPQPTPKSWFVREERKTDRRRSWGQLSMKHKVFLNELSLPLSWLVEYIPRGVEGKKIK